MSKIRKGMFYIFPCCTGFCFIEQKIPIYYIIIQCNGNILKSYSNQIRSILLSFYSIKRKKRSFFSPPKRQNIYHHSIFLANTSQSNDLSFLSMIGIYQKRKEIEKSCNEIFAIKSVSICDLRIINLNLLISSYKLVLKIIKKVLQ